MPAIQIGDKAPDFVLPTVDGQDIRLSDLRGKKVLLSFYRFASCPLCNFRIAQLRKKYPKLHDEHGLEVLSVFHSPLDSMKKHVGNSPTDFPLLYDPERISYQKYEVKKSVLGWFKGAFKGLHKIPISLVQGAKVGKPDGPTTTLPADFLIDENGIVRDVYMASSIDDHMPWDRIEAFVKQELRSEAPLRWRQYVDSYKSTNTNNEL